MSIRNISDVESLLKGTPQVRQLHSLWEQGRPLVDPEHKKSYGVAESAPRILWLEDLSLAQRFTSQAIRQEEFLLTLDAAREILQGWANADEDDRTRLTRIRMDYALALTRLGFTKEARAELEPCVEPGYQPELGRRLKTDILLRLGDIQREEWHYATDRTVRIKAAREALAFYKRALELAQDFDDPNRLEALVRVSSTLFILSQWRTELRPEAQEKAHQIIEATRKLKDTDGPRRRTTWAEGTAHAVLGETSEAARSFGQLQEIPDITTPQLAEARFEAQSLAEALGESRDFFKTAFPPLQLIVFAGHLPDSPEHTGTRVRFPPSSIPGVQDVLRTRIRKMKARVGLSSASAGADLLFAEALRELKGTMHHLVLPWSQDEFRRTSVLPYEPPGDARVWEPLYDKALETAATTREIGHLYEPSDDLGWEFTMEVMAGIALQAARALRLDIQPMVLWDGKPGFGVGGTDSFHTFWSRKLDVKTIVLNLPAIASETVSAGTDIAPPGRGCERSIRHQEVKSMLFADIVGYSKLTEKTIPEFIGTFLEKLGQLCSTSKRAPCSVNTWGDAIYAVFDFARDAGLFALELAEMVEDGKPEWLAKGLYWESRSEEGVVVKNPLRIRIGLHTGPVAMHYDPVVRRIGFTGAHVNRAARIEPVTVPGQVFASEEFAAMAELSGKLQRRGGDPGTDLGFVCEYAGSMQLAKGFPGRYRIYRVVRKRDFTIEPLARAVHEAFCDKLRARGETPATHTSMRPWEELSEDLRDANRAQVADIPVKLRLLGLELTAGEGIRANDIVIGEERLEELAIREHDRWMAERIQNGWTFAPVRDNSRKEHNLLKPWDGLSDIEKDMDRDTIRNMPKLIEKAGFKVRRIN